MFRKTIKGICLVFSLLAFANATHAQKYEDMPPQIQKKMDDNKRKGVALMEGVKADYEFTILNVNDATAAGKFESFMKKEFGVTAFAYNSTTKHVSFTVPAKHSMEEMKSKMKPAGYGFDLFFKEFFHL